MTLSTGKMFKAVTEATGAVVLAGWLLVVCEYAIFPDMKRIAFFNLNEEINLPTWWSAVLLLICSGLTGLAAVLKKGRPFYWGWFFLALGFMFMSLDEVAQLHEKLSGPLREAWHLSGFLYYGWVVPGAALILVAGLAYLRFFLALPKGTRAGFFLGWAAYLAGVLGLETWGALAFSRLGADNLYYGLLAAFEETVEMAGLLILIRVFLTYLQREMQGRGAALAR